MNFDRQLHLVVVWLWIVGLGLFSLPGSLVLAQDNPPPAPPSITPPPPPTVIPPPPPAVNPGAAPAMTNAPAENRNEVAPKPPPPAPPAPVQSVAVTPEPQENLIEFEFSNATVLTVVEYYAKLTNRSIISAPNLPGQITFHCQTKLTVEEAIQALDSVLAINQIAVIPLGDKFLKVVQINTALPEGVAVGVSDKPQLPAADKLVIQIVPLKYADATEIAGTLQTYKHTYGQAVALGKSNSILLADTAATINHLMEIVGYMDQPSPLRMQTKVYVITRAKAAEVVQRLQDVMQQTQQLGARATVATPQPVPQPMPGRIPFQPRPPGVTGGAPGEETVVEGKVIITADERTNKIFILSRESNFPFFDQMIAELDAKVEPDVITKVIPLNYANADDIAGILNSLVTGGTTPARRTTTGTTPGGAPRPANVPPPPSMGGTGGGAGVEGAGLLQFAEGVRILPDPRTNSLLVMATKQDMQRIEELVNSLDTAVAQVLIEVVIGEVTLDNKLEVGVNWMKRLEKQGLLSTMGGTSVDGKLPTPAPDLTGLAAGSGLPQGMALSSALTYFATFRNLRLDAAIRLLHSTSNFRVLSTPIILTLHNQEANIKVGESRPIITATLSGVTTVTSSNQAAGSFQSNVEYKDIAIELKVTPRINPDGFVTMDIDQKVNDIGGTVNISGNEQPIITTREAKSSVTVKDQGTIVLGGLIKEQNGVTESKVPFLGDIPLLGHLFKSKSNTKSRTELIVFIRPTVLRDEAQATAEALRRSRMLKGADKLELEKILKDVSPDGKRLGAKDKPAAAPPTPPAEDQKPAVPEPLGTPAPAN